MLYIIHLLCYNFGIKNILLISIGNIRRIFTMSSFKEIKPEQMEQNPFEMIGKDWLLLSAGNEESFNTMTVSWGGVGVLWGKNVVFTFIRPQRYTLGFVDSEEYFTLSGFGSGFRKELGYCGSKSGRDVDKAKETGLVPMFDEEAPYFEQAKIVLVCKKLYKQDFSPECFIDPSLDSVNYAAKDYHKMFVGEIVKVLVKE